MCVTLPPGLDPAVLRDELIELWTRKDVQMVRVTFTTRLESAHAVSPVCVHVCVLMRKAECLSVGRKEGICIALNEPEMCVRRILRG